MAEVSCCDRRAPVLVEVRGEYDGGLFYECAECHTRWHRFEEGHYLHRRAEKYVNSTLSQEGADV